LHPNWDVYTHQEAHRRARNLGLVVAREISSLFKPVMTRIKLLQQYEAIKHVGKEDGNCMYNVTQESSDLCKLDPSHAVTPFN
jgi:hypothetical protein